MVARTRVKVQTANRPELVQVYVLLQVFFDLRALDVLTLQAFVDENLTVCDGGLPSVLISEVANQKLERLIQKGYISEVNVCFTQFLGHMVAPDRNHHHKLPPKTGPNWAGDDRNLPIADPPAPAQRLRYEGNMGPGTDIRYGLEVPAGLHLILLGYYLANVNWAHNLTKVLENNWG